MDKEKSQSLIQESLKQKESFSSRVVGIAQDAYPPQKEYHIPQSYDVDRVVLMPVNLNTYHIYWDISDALLHQMHLPREIELSFRMVDGEHNVLEEFFTNEKSSKRYINKTFDNLKLQVICGYYQGDRYITLLYSNSIKSFNSQIILPNPEDEVWLSKEKGFSQIIRMSLQHCAFGISSASYLKQIEKLQEYSKSKTYSSDAFVKKGGDDE